MGERMTCALKDILEMLELNPNQLSNLVKVREKTLYAMYHNQAKSIKLDNAEKILDALNEYAERNNIDQRFNTQDLFPYLHKIN